MRDLAAEVAAERAVIGAVMLDPSKAQEMLSTLSPDDMMESLNREAFDAIGHLVAKQSPIDVVSVASVMAYKGSQASDHLLQIASDTPTAENIKHYIDIVRRSSALRKIATSAAQTLGMVKDDIDPETILEKSSAHLASIATRRSDRLTSIADVLPGLLEDIDNRRDNIGGQENIRSGIVGLDEITTGLRPGQLIVLAGDTGAGKTSAAMQYMYESALTQDASWYAVNMEMMKKELAERGLCYAGNIDSHFLRIGSLSSATARNMVDVATKLSKLPIYLEDEIFNIGDVVSRARAWRAKHPGKGGAVIDYLQLANGLPGLKRHEEISGMAKRLKQLAKELAVPIILLSQLNREGKKAERPPAKHDLRDSGEIEDAADLILLIHRKESLPDGSISCDMIVAKQRGGPTGVVPVRFVGKHYRFVDDTPTPGEFHG